MSSFVASDVYDSASSNSATVTKPAGTADGDILFALVKHNANEAFSSTPSGWTQLGTSRWLTTSSSMFSLFYKVASSEPADYTWTWATAARTAIRIAAYRGGFDTADPIDVVSDSTYQTNDTTLRAAAMTASAANSVVLFFGGTHISAAQTFTPPTAPASMTEDLDAYAGGGRLSHIFARLDWTGSGSTGDMDATISAANDQKHAFAVALNPPAGDTTPPVLTSPVGSATSSTAATVGATTDEGNGTLYAVVTGSATQPSIAQIKAGNDHTGSAAAWSGSVAVSSTGAKTLNATGLTSGSSYYAHLVHTDAAANDSNRVTSSQWTQLVKKVKLLLDLAAAGETVDGIVWANQSGAVAGAEIGEFTSQTIGTGSGGDAGFAVLKVPVSAFGGGSLSVGDTVQMYVRKPDLSKDSNVWPATVIEE